MSAREPVPFWRDNAIAVVSLRYSTTRFCENGVRAKSSFQNVGSFIILLSGKGLKTTSNKNHCANVFAYKEE